MGYRLIVVGGSLGGMRALQAILTELPKEFPLSLAVVLHRAKDTEDRLSGCLQLSSAMPVMEPADKQAILDGYVYIAPADYHLLVEVGVFSLSVDAPVSYARPSIDVLFESAADAYGKDLIGVILTGANADGAAGLVKIRAKGGLAVVEDPSTAQCAKMPSAAIEAAGADWILPSEKIGPLLRTVAGDLVRM